MEFDFVLYSPPSPTQSEDGEPLGFDDLEFDLLCDEWSIAPRIRTGQRSNTEEETYAEIQMGSTFESSQEECQDKEADIVVQSTQEESQEHRANIVLQSSQNECQRRDDWHFGCDREFRERNEAQQDESILKILCPGNTSSQPKSVSNGMNGSSKQLNRLTYCNYPPQSSPVSSRQLQEQWKMQSVPADFLQRLSFNPMGSPYNTGISTPPSSRFVNGSQPVSQVVRRQSPYLVRSASSLNSFGPSSPYTNQSPSNGYFNKEVITPVSSRYAHHNYSNQRDPQNRSGYSGYCSSALEGNHVRLPRYASYRMPTNEFQQKTETKLAGYPTGSPSHQLHVASRTPVNSFGTSPFSRHASTSSLGSRYDLPSPTLRDLLNRPIRSPFVNNELSVNNKVM